MQTLLRPHNYPFWLFLLLLAAPGQAAKKAAPAPANRLLLVHYMPWFAAKPLRPQWGWHWTMNHANPNKSVNGRQEAASHFRPFVGLYDSGDPDALRCQVMLMKLSGIDGVVFDWYGRDAVLDYAANNRNVEQMIPILREAGLRYALCYEPQTVPKELQLGTIPAGNAVAHGERLMAWMQPHFFASSQYVTLQNRPVLLAFGDPYYTGAQWSQILSAAQPRPLFFTEGGREGTAASGAFDWPQPGGGTEAGLTAQETFSRRAQADPLLIPAAFPRFNDIYREMGVGKSYGHIDDRDGRTYEETLTKALQSRASLVQIVTWNDWGEGTQIEPSVEVGYRDLETTQRVRRRCWGRSFAGTPADLRLPVRWYRLRKKYADNPSAEAHLAKVFTLVVGGRMAEARAAVENYPPLP